MYGMRSPFLENKPTLSKKKKPTLNPALAASSKKENIT